MTTMDVTLRPALPEDCALLFAYRNDAQVVENSLTGEPVVWEDHHRWYQKKLEDPHCRIFIAEDAAGAPVGQLRLDLAGDTGTITYSIEAGRRGGGYGSALIAAAETAALGLGIHRLVAMVRGGNHRSVRIFLSHGYLAETGGEALRFVKVLF